MVNHIQSLFIKQNFTVQTYYVEKNAEKKMFSVSFDLVRVYEFSPYHYYISLTLPFSFDPKKHANNDYHQQQNHANSSSDCYDIIVF